VVVCRSGGRSAQVVSYLIGHGWDNVRNLHGGMRSWAALGRPVVSENGQPAQIL
jgi:rhodanese-related sulfurtransferase